MGLVEPGPTVDLVFLGQEEVSVQVLLVGQEEPLEEVSVVELVAGLEQGSEEESGRVLVGQGVASVQLWAME